MLVITPPVGDNATSCFIWRTICVNSTLTKISILLFKTGAGVVAEKYHRIK